MIKAILCDFSRVILHPKDRNYKGSLNGLYRKLLEQKNFNFFAYYELNNELLDFLKKLKNKYHLYLLTSEIIQNAPEVKPVLKEVFEKIFSAKDLSLSKTDPLIYKTIAEKINKLLDEIIFIDDTMENIKAAEKAGLKTINYNKQAIRDLKKL